VAFVYDVDGNPIDGIQKIKGLFVEAFTNVAVAT
jgi:hypothetical protein